MDLHGAEVGEEAQGPSERQEARLRPRPRGGIVPLRTADRAEEDRVRPPGDLQRPWRQRVARLVDGNSSHQPVLEQEAVPKALSHGVKNSHRLLNDLGAYPVAGQQRNRIVHGVTAS